MEVAAAMVVAPLLTAAMNTLMPKMLRIVEDRSSLRQDVRHDVESLRKELKMMWSAVQEYNKSARINDQGAVQGVWINLVSKLAHRIEDCVDQYIYDQFAGTRNYVQFAEQIKELMKESNEISEMRKKYTVDDGATTSTIPTTGESSSSRSCAPVLPLNLVGTDAPLRELRDLMEEEQDEGQPKRLKVISILGFDGLGKTALATQVYDVAKQFGGCRAWVNAADKDPRQVLLEILQQLHEEKEVPQPSNTTNGEKLCEQIRTCLQNKRYFIVIDDMRTHLWSTIKAAFPQSSAGRSGGVPVSPCGWCTEAERRRTGKENGRGEEEITKGLCNRVLVTTSIESIAKECCSKTGCVYRMQGLNAHFSEDLFFKSAYVKQPSKDIKDGSEELRMKCNGLPLALVSVGEWLHLRKDGPTPTGDTCRRVCRNLGDDLDAAGKDTALARMQEVLTRSYNCLTRDTAKACLVCIGMFPSGHRIRGKRLIRRWLAEGVFEKIPHHQHGRVDKAVADLEMLIDRNIVQPFDISNNYKVRSCQPPGMMLEFIRHRSMSENSTALFCDEMLLKIPGYARRISLHHRSAPQVQEGEGCDLSLVRSLTIFGKACQYILSFDKYRLLRVLDLEECVDLTNGHLKGICKLFLLNYLSLGGTVTELPREITRLEYLETLDVRRANVEVAIPLDVVMLTSLMHLFGKFKFVDSVSKKLTEFLKSGKSNLEILAGFVITDSNDGFLQLLVHMKNLKKVKIWCKPSPDSSNKCSSNNTNLSSALQRYIEDNKDPNIDRSLSLEFDASFKDVSQFSPEEDFYSITSLKLRGDLLELPHFVASLLGLKELCLSSITTLRGSSILRVLSQLSCLVYLQLVAEELDDFVVSDETRFDSLQRLCIKVQGSKLLKIEGNPLPQLVSFQLLYNNPESLPLINIQRLECLRELTLYFIDNAESRNTWEDAAKRHPNRPRVFFVEKESCQAEASAVPEEASSQRSNKWKNIWKLPKFLKQDKTRTRASASVGTNNGHPDSMSPIIHKATGAHADTSGSTAAPTADGCTAPREGQVDESISNRL